MLSRYSFRTGGVFLLLGFLALSAGCGPDYKARATVKGKVTFNGKNLTAGSVVFYGKDNLTGSAGIQSDGTYVMNDAPIGDVKVTVSVPQPPPGGLGHLKGAPMGPAPPGEAKPAAEKIPTQIVRIPEKYASVESSGLTYKVEKGEHTYDIPLTP